MFKSLHNAPGFHRKPSITPQQKELATFGFSVPGNEVIL